MIDYLIKPLVREHSKVIELARLRQHRDLLCGRLADEVVEFIKHQNVRAEGQISA